MSMAQPRSVIIGLMVLFGATLVAQAQPASPPPQPTIGIPLPSIGLPLPPIGISPREIAERQNPVQPPKDSPAPARRPALVVFGVAPYMWGFESWQQARYPGALVTEPATVAEPDPIGTTGRLQLEVRPRDAQIFVNGEFFGTWEDIAGVLELPEGTHRIEIRAPRYQAVSLDARIVADRTITYRATLEPVEERKSPPPTPPAKAPTSPSGQEPPTPARPAQTFYLIPGCYLGNVPPEQVKLPPNCDLSRVITHTPGK